MGLYAFDGTWNHPDYNSDDGKDTNTNVFRFVELYRECSGDDGKTLTAEYISGIGIRHRLLVKAVGADGHERDREMLKRYAASLAGGDDIIDIVGLSRGEALALDFSHDTLHPVH